MNEVCFTTMETPIGRLLIAGSDAGLLEIRFPEPNGDGRIPAEWREDPASLSGPVSQLRAYFAGERREFDLTLAPKGTSFQQHVWRTLQSVPYGETISYRELATRIDRPAAVRAVGAANGANPIPIVIPCHRVVGSDGRLVGYGGGLDIKRRLLELEGASRILSTP